MHSIACYYLYGEIAGKHWKKHFGSFGDEPVLFVIK